METDRRRRSDSFTYHVTGALTPHKQATQTLWFALLPRARSNRNGIPKFCITTPSETLSALASRASRFRLAISVSVWLAGIGMHTNRSRIEYMDDVYFLQSQTRVPPTYDARIFAYIQTLRLCRARALALLLSMYAGMPSALRRDRDQTSIRITNAGVHTTAAAVVSTNRAPSAALAIVSSRETRADDLAYCIVRSWEHLSRLFCVCVSARVGRGLCLTHVQTDRLRCTVAPKRCI